MNRILLLVLLTTLPTRADDTARLAALLAAAPEHGGTVTIPPGEYQLSGASRIKLTSGMRIQAHGARFILPEKLADKARLVLFHGIDLESFEWHGGEFIGHVFDPDRKENNWEPNANTRTFLIETSPKGTTRDILFRDVHSSDIAGAVISVQGVSKGGSESEVIRYAERITLENCTLLRSGKFMWDYGFLWQQVIWPEDYQPWEVERAWKYFRKDLVRENLRMADGDDRVLFVNTVKPIKVSAGGEPNEALCFLGPDLPKNIIRGKQYFIVESGADFVKISDKAGGPPIKFDGAAGEGTKLVNNLAAVHLSLYAPEGSGPGKGAFDLVACKDLRVTGCRLSALGDSMHIQRSSGILFSNNQITGSRMGAFFLAEFCKNAVITGNTIDGTNGSRVMSVEKSCEDVVITGNTFRNGGRGSWINQPKNFVMTGNVFVNNTTKNQKDPRKGRRSFLTGEYETKPELYFTLYEKGGAYGPVIVRDNLFTLGPDVGTPAITFAGGGKQILFKDNIFRGVDPLIRMDPACTEIEVKDNPGVTFERAPVDFNHGRR